MIPVYLESPYANGGTADDTTIARNIRYLRACVRDCLLRGEAPYATHALYTQPGVLRDEVPEERRFGIDAGQPFRQFCEKTVIYVDLTPGVGVKEGEARSRALGLPVEVRTLGEGWEQTHAELAWLSRAQDIWRSV